MADLLLITFLPLISDNLEPKVDLCTAAGFDLHMEFQSALTAWRPTSPAAAVGLAVEYLSTKPAFAALPFGEWSQVLFHQVVRGHYVFVVDADRRICGFLGWALTEFSFAELWMGGGPGLKNQQSLEGDCVIVNAWSADTAAANQFLREAALKLFANRRAVYFKRHYPNGHVRPMRIKVPAHRALIAKTSTRPQS